MSTASNKPLQELLERISDREAELLRDPRHRELPAEIGERMAEIMGRVDSHAQELGLRADLPEKVVIDHRQVPVSDISIKSGAEVPGNLPKALGKEIEQLALECEYLLMEEERFSRIPEDEIPQVLEAFDRVKDRIPQVIQQLEALQENVFCRLMLQALRRGLANLEQLALSQSPRAKLLQLQHEMKECVLGKWPMYDAETFKATGLMYFDNDPRVPLFEKIQAQMHAIVQYADTGHPDHAQMLKMHEIHGELQSLNAACCRLVAQFKQEGLDQDPLAVQLFEEKVLYSFREFSRYSMKYLELLFGNDLEHPPTPEDLKKAEQVEQKRVDLMLENDQLFFG